MESVKSIGKSMIYSISKIHTNVEFTFSNNTKIIQVQTAIVKQTINVYIPISRTIKSYLRYYLTISTK